MEGARQELPQSQPGLTELPRIAPQHVPAWRAVLLPFVLSRAMLVALTIVLAFVTHHGPLAMWNVLDTRWYVGIATHGYHWSVDGKPAVAFYPLYPLLIHLGQALHIPGVAAGLLVANLAYLGALFYVRAWVAESWDQRVASRTVWIVTFLPTGFFFFAPYSESLALLCAAGAFYHARHVQVLRAGLWAAAAILTRPTGLILLPSILLYLALGRRGERPPGDRRLLSLLAGIPAVLSVATYLWYLHTQNIPLTALAAAQRSWHRSLTVPWTGFTTSIGWLVGHPTGNPGWITENLLQLGVTILFLAVTVAAWRELDASERAYCAAFWSIVLITPEWRDGYFAPFSSMDRFVLLLFPLFAWTAAHMRVRRMRSVVGASAAFMVAAASVHLLGGWVG